MKDSKHVSKNSEKMICITICKFFKAAMSPTLLLGQGVDLTAILSPVEKSSRLNDASVDPSSSTQPVSISFSFSEGTGTRRPVPSAPDLLTHKIRTPIFYPLLGYPLVHISTSDTHLFAVPYPLSQNIPSFLNP